MRTAIKVENLSKVYRLGEVGTGSLMQDFKTWSEQTFRRETTLHSKKAAEHWALRDVSFEVKQGEVLGIIGKNGAGKSTLLKILSKVTAPSSGQVKINGRIASLLEVGTGFHSDLSGRDNIFLNGAILGMTKAEIKNKFDEIVDFSGIEKFIDTPVKRYSSGMYVRLAFAVAAHLEPEILIIDEVLAVGDAEFQKKCLGKMKDVAGHGRTVLFVSHNMTAVSELCTQGMLVHEGMIAAYGQVKDVVQGYYANQKSENHDLPATQIPREISAYSERCSITGFETGKTTYAWRENLGFKISITRTDPRITEIEFGIGFNDHNGVRICTYESPQAYAFNNGDTLSLNLDLDEPKFIPGTYYASMGIRSGVHTLDAIENAVKIEVLQIDANGKHFGFSQGGNVSGWIDVNGKVLVQ